MFGKINSWEQVGLIAEGWTKDIVKAELNLHDERMKICVECPLFTKDSIIGPRCDAHKCINTKTGELVNYPGPNVVCGCSCALDKKTRVKNARCVLNKW